MAKTERVEISTVQFEMAHGHGPRGRGGWGFFFDGADRTEQVWWAPSGSTYVEARRAAVVEARRRGATFVEVAS